MSYTSLCPTQVLFGTRAVPASELTNGMRIMTLRGEVVTVTINDDGVFFDDAKVVGADISACNGIIHEIDSVRAREPHPHEPLNPRA